jgi:hypothetical protein
MSRVIDRLYVGGADEAFAPEMTALATHVLNVAAELDIKQRVGLAYAHIGVGDDDARGDIRSILDACVEWVDAAMEAGGVVMVHCLEGKSRSVCVCAAYLCVKLGHDLDAALALLRVRRPQTDIFPLYADQLLEYVTARVLPNTFTGKTGPLKRPIRREAITALPPLLRGSNHTISPPPLSRTDDGFRDDGRRARRRLPGGGAPAPARRDAAVGAVRSRPAGATVGSR